MLSSRTYNNVAKVIIGAQALQLFFSNSHFIGFNSFLQAQCILISCHCIYDSFSFRNALVMSKEEVILQSAAHSDSSTGRSSSGVGLVITGLLGGAVIGLYAATAPFVAPALRKVCLPFVPATTEQVQNVFKVLRARTGNLVDIGSGDGRIVSALSPPVDKEWNCN